MSGAALLSVMGPLSVDGAMLVGQGLLVGIAVTAPPGPVGGLCIQRTLRGGLAYGLATALGALLADGLYGTIAAFGLAQFASPTGVWRTVVALVAASALAFLGVRYVLRARRGVPATQSAADPKASRFAGLLGLVAGTFALTLWTPGTLPAFVVMFAGMGLAGKAAECTGGALLVVLGVIVGAATWWFLLCCLVHRFRAHAQGWLRGVEYACGFLLLLGAAGALWTGFSD